MIRPDLASLYFYEALEGMTAMFDYVQSRTHEWDDVINDLANAQELYADIALKIAAEHNWAKAISESGIRDCWDECQQFFEEELATFFKID